MKNTRKVLRTSWSVLAAALVTGCALDVPRPESALVTADDTARLRARSAAIAAPAARRRRVVVRRVAQRAAHGERRALRRGRAHGCPSIAPARRVRRGDQPR